MTGCSYSHCNYSRIRGEFSSGQHQTQNASNIYTTSHVRTCTCTGVVGTNIPVVFVSDTYSLVPTLLRTPPHNKIVWTQLTEFLVC